MREQIFFSASLFFLLLGLLWFTYWYSWWPPPVSPALSIFFVLFSFCWSVWIISVFLHSSSVILSSACPRLLLNPSSENFISVNVLFNSRTCLVQFIISIYWDSDFVHTFPWFSLILYQWFPLALWAFKTVDLTSMTSNSNVWGSSGMVLLSFFKLFFWYLQAILNLCFLYVL